MLHRILQKTFLSLKGIYQKLSLCNCRSWENYDSLQCFAGWSIVVVVPNGCSVCIIQYTI